MEFEPTELFGSTLDYYVKEYSSGYLGLKIRYLKAKIQMHRERMIEMMNRSESRDVIERVQRYISVHEVELNELITEKTIRHKNKVYINMKKLRDTSIYSKEIYNEDLTLRKLGEVKTRVGHFQVYIEKNLDTIDELTTWLASKNETTDLDSIDLKECLVALRAKLQRDLYDLVDIEDEISNLLTL
jgi:hypothetical protein